MNSSIEDLLKLMKAEDYVRLNNELQNKEKNIYDNMRKNKHILQKKLNNSKGKYTGSGYYACKNDNDQLYVKRYHTTTKHYKKMANKKTRRYSLDLSNGSYYKKLLDISWLII